MDMLRNKDNVPVVASTAICNTIFTDDRPTTCIQRESCLEPVQEESEINPVSATSRRDLWKDDDPRASRSPSMDQSRLVHRHSYQSSISSRYGYQEDLRY